MKGFIRLLAILCATCAPIYTAQTPAAPCPDAPQYGNDPNGRFVKVNAISLYYEIYGEGEPLLLVHGNGGSINGVRCQIAYFSRSHRVIVADSPSHGRSESIVGRLTYEQIADDLSALLTELKIDRTDVWGHSDGGIVALLLGIRHPQQIAKLIASSANLRPDETALLPGFIKNVRRASEIAADMIKSGDRSRDWVRFKQQQDMMLEEPHIAVSDLQKIAAPTLVIGADSDIMPLTHTLEIFNGIPHAQLFIMPGTTHGMIRTASEFYNSVVARFLDAPFTRP